MFRFLHLADLHLSSPLAAFPSGVAERWRGAQFAALEELLSRAVGAGASLLLFSGDVFDTPRAPREDVARFYDILARAGVPAIVAPGNHDFYTPDGTWHAAPPPENLCLFTERELGFLTFRNSALRFMALPSAPPAPKRRRWGSPPTALPGGCRFCWRTATSRRRSRLTPRSRPGRLPPRAFPTSRWGISTIRPRRRASGARLPRTAGFSAGAGLTSLAPGTLCFAPRGTTAR